MPEPNPKGEVTLDLDTLEDPITLQYTFDDFADADELLGRSVMRELAEAEEGGTVRYDTLRALLYIGARPDPQLRSPSDARGLITFTNREQVTQGILSALYAAMPGEEEAEGEADDPTEAAGASTTSGS